jgi:hypothetical protein
VFLVFLVFWCSGALVFNVLCSVFCVVGVVVVAALAQAPISGVPPVF